MTNTDHVVSGGVAAEDDRPLAYSYIRFSTPAQKEGDSFRRQMVASVRYCERHDPPLKLVEDASAYHDFGVSGYRGRNVKEGLGRFLKAIGEGKIKPGSFLLVENIDRISRNNPYDAADIIKAIIDAGLSVVDLSDRERVYNSVTIRQPGVYSVLVARCERAHDESKRKSGLSHENWDEKRRNAGTKRMTKVAPAWIDREKWEAIPDRAKLVNDMYDWACSGSGVNRIMRQLNGSYEGFPKVPTWGRAEEWEESYVIKILKNKAVYGVLQRWKFDDDNVRRPVGPEVENYYPPVMTKEKWERTQAAIATRLHNAKGRKGEHYTNLFQGMLKCGNCGGTIRLENKGSGANGGQYLICRNVLRGTGCHHIKRWRYGAFEDAMLKRLEWQLRIKDVVVPKIADQQKKWRNELQALDGSDRDLAQRRNRLLKQVEDGVFKQDEIKERISEIRSAQRINEERRIAIEQAKRTAEVDVEAAASAQEVYELIKNLRIKKDWKKRAAVASKMKSLISMILVWPHQTQDAVPKWQDLEHLEHEAPSDTKTITRTYYDELEGCPGLTMTYFKAGLQPKPGNFFLDQQTFKVKEDDDLEDAEYDHMLESRIRTGFYDDLDEDDAAGDKKDDKDTPPAK